jgi:septal ring factor EnvC (AmiA/AmiB activator)
VATSECQIVRVFVLLGVISIGSGVYAQQRKDLEEQKSKTQQEIEYTSRILDDTRKNRQNTIQRVRILNKRIQLRNQIISNIGQEITLIDQEIKQKSTLIKDMEKNVETLKKQYEELIIKAYWNRNRQDWLMYVMSAETFNQAYRRMKYLQQLSLHRRSQAEILMELKSKLVLEIEELEIIKLEKKTLAKEKRNETHQLELERRNKNQMVAQLSKREKELKEEIRKKEAIAAKLEKEIAAIIEQEARKTRSRNIYSSLTPEEKLISDNFMGNKGKLPWPVERGIITGKFGVQAHPVLKQVIIDNDGVDISTVKGAEARALFDGEVTKVVAILGANYTVIIRHGNFLTVYQNLVDLKVKQGDKVRVKQVLGTVHTDNETNNTILHIQIWKERSIQNPEDWISRTQ